VAGNSSAENASIIQWPQQNSPNQFWRIGVNEEDYHTVLSIETGKTINIENNATQAGARLVQNTRNGTPNQQWIITEENCPTQQASSRTAPVHTLAARQKGDRALLNFVSNIKGVDYYVVEKLNPETGKFEAIGSVENSVLRKDLTKFIAFDEKPHDGDNSYKIVAYLFNSTIEETEVRTVNFGKLGELLVYPNPATTEFNVLLRNFDDMPATIYLTDMYGRTLKVLKTDGVNNNVSINSSDLVSGQYYLRIVSKKRPMISKSIIIKNEQ